eukprot:5173141-Amphidinium_carterae.2
MPLQYLAQLSKLLSEAELNVVRLGKEYTYTGGNPVLMRAWLESKDAPDNVYLVITYVFVALATLLYGTIAIRNGAPSGNKSSSWSSEARGIMRAAGAAMKSFEGVPGFTLGALTSSLPEVALVVLILDPARPMVPLLSLPIAEALRLSIQEHANMTIGQNSKGSAAAKAAADSAQRANAIGSYHGADMMRKIMKTLSEGGAFIEGTLTS